MKKNRLLTAKKILKMGPMPPIELKDLGKFFKPEEAPQLEPTPLGRHRLIQALRMKYGESFRNKSGVSSLIKDFDEQVKIRKGAIELRFM